MKIDNLFVTIDGLSIIQIDDLGLKDYAAQNALSGKPDDPLRFFVTTRDGHELVIELVRKRKKQKKHPL